MQANSTQATEFTGHDVFVVSAESIPPHSGHGDLVTAEESHLPLREKSVIQLCPEKLEFSRQFPSHYPAFLVVDHLADVLSQFFVDDLVRVEAQGPVVVGELVEGIFILRTGPIPFAMENPGSMLLANLESAIRRPGIHHLDIRLEGSNSLENSIDRSLGVEGDNGYGESRSHAQEKNLSPLRSRKSVGKGNSCGGQGPKNGFLLGKSRFIGIFAPESGSGMPYRKDIDGLRAIAVLAVILFHFNLGFPGGYAGVDVFFVISGFLIGSIIIGKAEQDRFRLTDFWLRRIRRLLPALFALVIAVSIASYFWMVPAHLEEIGKSILAQPALAANIYFFQESGYFETASEYQPLLHTWSLAVEEQFYLALPFLLPLFLRWGSGRAALGRAALLVGVISVLSLAWSIYGSISYQSFTFYMILSRSWELNIGVLLALYLAKTGPITCSRSIRETLSFAGLGMILICFLTYGVDTPFPSYTALLPCLGTAFLLFANSPHAGEDASPTLLQRSTSLPPLVFLGQISYSLYLWHWPVFVFFHHITLREMTLLDKVFGVGLSLVLATVSWKWVEQPIRKGTFLKSTRSLLLNTAGAVAVMIAIGLYFSESKGLPERFSPEVIEMTDDPSTHYRIRAWDYYQKHQTFPTLGPSPEEADRQMLIWGDSHALALLPLLEELATEHNICLHIAAHPSTPPLLDVYTERIGKSFLDWGNLVLDYAGENTISTVLLHARWRIYTEGPPDGDMRSLVSTTTVHSRTPGQAEEVFLSSLERTLRALEEEGLTIALMDDVPFQPKSVPETVILAGVRGMDPNTLGPRKETQQALTRRIDKLIEKAIDGTSVLHFDPDPYLLDKETDRFALLRDEKILFTDQHHLSPNGTRQLRPLLEPFFTAERTADP